MANKTLFESLTGAPRRADIRNEAGGLAFALSAEEALAQLAFTGCLNGAFYCDAADQLDAVLRLAGEVDDAFVARLAVAARHDGHMKDMPALLCAILAKRNGELLERVFATVIDNGRMLRTFVQIVRSGVTGRRSLGSRPRRLVRRWLDGRSDAALFRASVGNDPSLADIVKMVHPKPRDTRREALYAYLIGKPHQAELLPEIVRHFEAFKRGETAQVPDVPFRFLTSMDLDREAWKAIARAAGWQMTRMNLNTFQRHGVLEDFDITRLLAARLRDAEEIRKARVFPYQLMTTYQNIGEDVPRMLRDALHDALEIATANVPELPGGAVHVAVDVSGSMHGPITGYRKGATGKTRCVDVAALIAAVLLRENRAATLIPFSDRLYRPDLDPRDTVMTNARKLTGYPAGGTDCSLPVRQLNETRARGDLIVIVSDQESWIDTKHRWRSSTGLLDQFRAYKRRNPRAKLVCIDLAPYCTVQAPPGGDIYHVGGFSDRVFDLLGAIASGDATQWVQRVHALAL